LVLDDGGHTARSKGGWVFAERQVCAVVVEVINKLAQQSSKVFLGRQLHSRWIAPVEPSRRRIGRTGT
jgi:hypothetical protein